MFLRFVGHIVLYKDIRLFVGMTGNKRAPNSQNGQENE